MLKCIRKTHIFIRFRVPFMNMNISCMYLARKKKLSWKTKWAKWKRLLAILSAHLPRFSSSFRLRFLYFHKTHNHFNKTELMTPSYSIYIYFAIRSLVEFKCLNLFSKYPFKKFCVSYVCCVCTFFQNVWIQMNRKMKILKLIEKKHTNASTHTHSVHYMQKKKKKYVCVNTKLCGLWYFFSGNIN